MRWLRRAKKPKVLADYGRVSEAVHARRTLRESEPAVCQLSSEEAWRAVRSFRPRQRLRDMRERVREFSEHSQDTPRTFEEDRQSGTEWMDRVVGGLALAGGGLVVGLLGGIVFSLWKKGASIGAELTLSMIGMIVIWLLVVTCVEIQKNAKDEAPRTRWMEYGGFFLTGFLAGLALAASAEWMTVT
jgi:hypothetical protein